MSPDCANIVCLDLFVGGHQKHILSARLRNQHPIEVPFNPEVAGEVGEGDDSLWKAVSGQLALPRSKRETKSGSGSARPTSYQNAFEQLALQVMRDVCNSDAAFIQHRDVDISPAQRHWDLSQSGKLNKNLLSVALSAVYWGGDFIQCMSVKGCVITGLLQRSQQLQLQEDQNHVTDAPRGWGLATLGADTTDPGGPPG